MLPHPVAAAAATREISSSRASSRSSTPLLATATATKGAAAQPAAAAALSFADWARKRYGFLDSAETSHYKIDGTTLGIDPDVMAFEWDEDELWDAYEERWGWRERERVARGEEGESGSEEEESSEGYEDDDTDDEDDEGSGFGSEQPQKRSSPPPPRARMAFTFAAAATEEDEESSKGAEDTITHGTEVVARLCHLASAAEGAVDPSDRLAALSQLDAMSRKGAVSQVPWRWKSLEEGQGRASNMAGMVEGKGRWATRNPFMRGTEQESGRGAHRLAKMTTAVANTGGAGGMAGSSRPRAAAARQRTLVSSSTSTSTSSSRASSADPAPTAAVTSTSAAAAASARPAPVPMNVVAVSGALYGIDDSRGAALGSDMTGFDSDPASAPTVWVPPVAAPARQIPHLGPFFLSPPSTSSRPAAASEPSPGSTAMRLETSSEGAAVIRSIHDISNANVTSPLLRRRRSCWRAEQPPGAKCRDCVVDC